MSDSQVPQMFIGFGLALIWTFWPRRKPKTVASVEAYVPTHQAERPVVKKTIDLDQARQDAVDGLMYYGMSKKAALAALESTGWRGYPDTIQMIQQVWAAK